MSYTTKLFIGPMSLNIVNVAIDLCGRNNINIGLIPSRRQIDFASGYVNNWKTATFVKYVKDKSKSIVLQRDHGGPCQGDTEDNGFTSLAYDAYNGFDLIHIDPWKKYTSIKEASIATTSHIKSCYSINANCEYEVGTEEAIRRYQPEEFDLFIKLIKERLNDNQWDKVKYGVIQSGTKLSSGRNTGILNKEKLRLMVNICNKHGLLSKEHNGDYLDQNQIEIRFKNGLDAINIAPEIANIESNVLMKNHKIKDAMFFECVKSNRWEKWFPKGFDPLKNKKSIVSICGHYVYSNPKISDMIKNAGLNEEINQEIEIGINRILTAINNAR